MSTKFTAILKNQLMTIYTWWYDFCQLSITLFMI